MFNKKQLWELISTEMQINVEPNAMKSGVKKLMTVKNEKNQTGNVNSEFFSKTEDIYFQDPHFNPILTALNKEKIPKKKKGIGDGRRTMSAYDIEKNRQKHEEKREQKERMFQWLQGY